MSKTTTEVKPVSILVLQRGWVAVGEASKNGQDIILDKAKIIRKWGTTQGLGEIAAGGPTENTILDPAGSIRVHELAVVLEMVADAAKWGEALNA